jgi:hypothetical protein
MQLNAIKVAQYMHREAVRGEVDPNHLKLVMSALPLLAKDGVIDSSAIGNSVDALRHLSLKYELKGQRDTALEWKGCELGASIVNLALIKAAQTGVLSVLADDIKPVTSEEIMRAFIG